MILIYITNPTKKVAEKLAKRLLKKRLIACANIFGIESFYWWKEKIQKAKEFVLIGKTREKNFEEIEKEILVIHPYETPCILKIKVNGSEKFLDWLKKETK